MNRKVILGILIAVIIAVVIWAVAQMWEDNAVKVQNGDSFTLSLESNPTTGYSWQADFDAEYLQLVDSRFISEAGPEIVGAGGQEEFDFLALKAGETEITFFYSRPWESLPPLEKKVYKVTIK